MVKFKYLIIICLLLFSNPTKLSNKQKKVVNLGFSTNNKEIDLLYISLFSLLENSGKNTIYHIYIQIKKNVEQVRIDLIYSLEQKYFNCFIHIIEMKNEFKKAFRNCLDVSTYFRLKLPEVCPNYINRIIFIDADTITLKDLIELYSLNFQGKYILGRLDTITDELDKVGVNTTTYINAGILLMDLYSLRKYNYVEKFMNHIKIHNNDKYLYHHAQSTINYICYGKIGLLTFKYHMWAVSSISSLYDFNKKFRIKYNESEFLNDFNDPFIVHFPGSFKKNWNINTTYHNKFNEYKSITKDFRDQKLNRNLIFFKYIIFVFTSIAKIIFLVYYYYIFRNKN